ncbi:OmpA family protein [Flammeovirga kamogawensis]|uniref:PD40 domain-containing protein n=1 Tax=Flammeovirga kamogawensis TaxID=373891 RepID=A0ABX8H322_9BACT|nr:OmpA family protein [Flammeovirga kamogawensis]MBB6460207.1 outer membrane protein OmpA-like peptidoglycan-associated protein/tetratricopeptide (TPR) repeat protein [Flammeovirga kamogawensis]QWG10019.1 PD40 domain-containing protein [Flammeovirga kamogawensis]TRX65527.1 OmpA family protein [Flammeovirga kamogawensis]
MKLFLFIYIFIICSFSSFGQKQKTFLDRANKAFERQEFALAIENYGKVHTLDLISRYRLAMSNQKILNYSKALTIYKSILDKQWEGKEDVYLNYGLMAKNLGQYGKAGDAFKKYLFKYPQDTDVRDLYLSCQQDYLNDLQKNKYSVQVENVLFNSPERDMSPLIFGDGIIYTSTRRDLNEGDVHHRDGDNFLEMYLINKDENGMFSNSNIVHEHIASNFHVGPSTYNESKSEFFFTVNLPRQSFKDDKNQIVHHLQIYQSKYNAEKNTFTRPSEINLNHKTHSIGHPTISDDGTKLYFISNQVGTHGGTDIYVSHLQDDGNWGEPINLGNVINTTGNELFPYWYDDNTLYFSSDRHIGLGGLDIFKATLENDSVTHIENIGAPFNSSTDDFSIVFNKKSSVVEGFFTSNRTGGVGSDDIYMFKQEEKNFVVLVIDSLTREPINNAIIECYDKQKMATHKFLTNETGYVRFDAEQKNQIESIAAMSSTYKYKELPITQMGKQENIYIIELVKGTNLQLIGNVYDAVSLERIKNSEVFLYDDDSTVIKSIGNTVEGHYEIILNSLPINNFLISNAKGYNSENTIITNPNPDKFGIIHQDIYLKKVNTENLVKIESIYYEFDSSRLTTSAITKLNRVLSYMSSNQNALVELNAHCDVRGSERYNVKLSLDRVHAAMSFLVGKGIDKSRVRIDYHGESLTYTDCIDCSESEHQLNRRTEIKIIKP